MDHQKQLQRYCRVCAKLMSTKEFCGSCRTKAKRYHDAKQVNSSLKEHPWKEHMASDCYMCSQLCMGRPSKSKGKSGRPCDGSNQSIANRILREAPPSMKAAGPLSPSRFLPPTAVSLSDLQCSLCSCIVDKPVQTPCGKTVCGVCISMAISKCVSLESYTCTSCSGVHTISDASYPAAPDLLIKVLGELLLTCDIASCSEVVALKNLKTHVQSGCKATLPTFSPSKLTIGQIVSRSLTSPPTAAERKAATSVVKRLMSSPPGPLHSSSVVKLPTAGQVSKNM